MLKKSLPIIPLTVARNAQKSEINRLDLKRLSRFIQHNSVNDRLNRPLSIILDLTYFCNLDCEGCGVDVHFVSKRSQIKKWELSFENAAAILRGVLNFAKKKNLHENLKICLGGGEPTLHPDFDRIVSYASNLFGAESISFDTNGTTLDEKRLRKLAQSVGNIGIGLDGDREYHDKWRDPYGRTGIKSVYDKVIKLLGAASKDRSIARKIEVIFTPTARNTEKFWEVVKIAKHFGITRLSCHRFMLTARARNRADLVPSAIQYLKLFEDVISAQEMCGFEVHFHHSFEELIYKMVRSDDMVSTIAPCKTRRASMCISPNLRMHFCPWFVGHPFGHLGVTLKPFFIKNDQNEDMYDISTAVNNLNNYRFSSNVCPIAAANARLPRFTTNWQDTLLECLHAEDECEKQIKTLIETIDQYKGTERQSQVLSINSTNIACV